MVKLKDIVYRPSSPRKENTDFGVGLVLTPGPDDGLYVKLIVENVSVQLPMRCSPMVLGTVAGALVGVHSVGHAGTAVASPCSLCTRARAHGPCTRWRAVCGASARSRCVCRRGQGCGACCCLRAAAMMTLAGYPVYCERVRPRRHPACEHASAY